MFSAPTFRWDLFLFPFFFGNQKREKGDGKRKKQLVLMKILGREQVQFKLKTSGSKMENGM